MSHHIRGTAKKYLAALNFMEVLGIFEHIEPEVSVQMTRGPLFI